MPKVSVVIPIYNAEPYLRECLDSVVTQTMSDIEIICVNDGSTDGSGDILREYADRDTRITVIESDNGGVSAARNRGFDATCGEYVIFLDADDYFEPSMLDDVYLRCVQDDAEIGVFKIRYLYTHRDLMVEAHWSLRTEFLPAATPFSHESVSGSIFSAITPCVWNKMFRRSFLVDKGLRFSPELKRAEDVPFTYVALAQAHRITVVDKALVNYRTGLAGTLQSTVHERPFDICRALVLTRDGLRAAGIFREMERDFVNAALDQLLYALSSVNTADAFGKLYGAIKDRYFSELGISDRPKEYFYVEDYFERYVKITQSPPEAYLFDEARSLRRRAEQVLDRATTTGEALDQTREQLEDAREDNRSREAELRATRKQLERVTARLDRLEASPLFRFARAVARIPRAIVRRAKTVGGAK
jgi:glycosyltransferase involved in cell wall biosynthesis